MSVLAACKVLPQILNTENKQEKISKAKHVALRVIAEVAALLCAVYGLAEGVLRGGIYALIHFSWGLVTLSFHSLHLMAMCIKVQVAAQYSYALGVFSP